MLAAVIGLVIPEKLIDAEDPTREFGNEKCRARESDHAEQKHRRAALLEYLRRGRRETGSARAPMKARTTHSDVSIDAGLRRLMRVHAEYKKRCTGTV